MLIYEKVVEGVRHLFGTMGSVPADTDSQLTYKDMDGDVVTPVLEDTYLDDGHGGIIRQSDEKFIAAFVDDTCVIPNENWAPVQKVLKEIKISKKPSKTSYVAGEMLDLTGMKVQAIYEDGDKEIVTDQVTTTPNTETALTVNDTEVVVAFEDKTATFAITVAEAAE